MKWTKLERPLPDLYAIHLRNDIKKPITPREAFELFQKGNTVEYLDESSGIKCEKTNPLFVTEDGVGIKEGESFYCVYKPDGSVMRGVARGLLHNNHDGKGFFSTKEAAQNSIPCLSVNDIVSLDKDLIVKCSNPPYDPGETIIIFGEQELKALAKSKQQ